MLLVKLSIEFLYKLEFVQCYYLNESVNYLALPFVGLYKYIQQRFYYILDHFYDSIPGK